MFRLAVLFLCVALVAALAGFGGVAGFSWGGARIIALLFLVLSAMYFATGWWGRLSPVASRRR
jgi:uncharacterized membrane protein YtjA (UPF0391 family)